MKRLLPLILCLFALTAHAESYQEQYSYAPTLLKHAQNWPFGVEEYLEFYDSIWGELTKAEGDIIFEALTEEQQALVHYPKFDGAAYFVPKGNAFHSTDWCYTLLRSKEIWKTDCEEAVLMGLYPCKKCVSPEVE